jgi:Uncharacterized conserved protein
MPDMANPELPLPDGLVLRPFRGVRYAVDDLASVTSPPYDLITPDDTTRLLAESPDNVVRVILPERSHRGYEQARDTLRHWLASGVLVPDALPALYVYEQSGLGFLQRGLIGDVALADPAQMIILPHEDVLPGLVADRLALMRTTQANLEPIFLLYDGGGPASQLVDEVATVRFPLIDIRSHDGIRHRLWAVTEPAEIDAVAADMHDRQALIADGHHRYATYRVFQRENHEAGSGDGPWDFGLALLVDSTLYPPDLKVIHRVIPGLSLTDAVTRAKGACQVHEYTNLEDALTGLAAAPDPAFVLAGEGDHAHLLTEPDPLQVEHAMPDDHSQQWKSLSTAVLTMFLLPRVWGLEDNEGSVLIVHHDPLAAVALARRHGGTAVLLKPPSADDIFAIAARGERVPRKSTSFGPKPRTGLVMRTLFNG